MTAAIVSITVALLALASAAYTARRSRRTSMEVEVLKSQLARASADEDARRAYEFAAKKRLYEECEPIVLKLAESCDYAASRIIALADARRWAELRAVRDVDSFWMLNKSSEIISLARALLEPLALAALLKEKVNPIDFSFDERVSDIYDLAKAAYQVHLDDYDIATIAPALVYDPVVQGWRAKRRAKPATYWWQGLTKGRLDGAIELVIHRDAGRVTTYGEFEERYLELFDLPTDSRTKSLGLFCNPIYNFDIDTRPVYWRMLMCQLLIYRRISKRSQVTSKLPTSTEFEFDKRDIQLLQRPKGIADEHLEPSLQVALVYTAKLRRDPHDQRQTAS